jgi:TolB-like protein/Flp pilus assembly protein TadD
LLNETIGNRAGSSERKNLLRRIYRKWKEALPDLEHAPLFTIPGRRKEYGGPAGKTYSFTDEEKDAWANLFEYKGSHENVRLHFSIDRLGATLDQMVVTYGEEPNITNEYSWDRFIESLKRELSDPDMKDRGPVAPTPRKRSWWRLWPWWSLGGVVGLLLMGVIVAIWYFSFHKPKSASDGFLFADSPLPLPDKPSIAVLPFVNMSGDPQQEYFSDGITEQIITSISKIPRLFVISRTSSFKYKGKAVDVKQVGRELGVKYVLEGSVQRSEDRLRITAQLTNTITGEHLWAERYDRRFKDYFALQDEITMKLMLSLAVKLTEGDRLRLRRPSTNNLKALEKFFEAVPYIRAFNRESNAMARHLIEEAIAIDPEFAGAYDTLACTHFMDVILGSSKSPRISLAQATKLLHKAIALYEDYPLAYSHLSYVYTMQRQYEKAIAEGEKAVALNPNSDNALVWLGMAMDRAGRSEEAIALYKKAMRLSPFPPSYYYLNLGHAYRSMERYKEAITEYNKALHLTPKNVIAFTGLAICYSLSGQEEEAHAAAAEILRINPKFSLKGWSMRLTYKDQALKERWRDALHKAGLK